MPNAASLSEWVNNKIGRRGKPFSSNYSFAEHVGVSEHTVRKLRKMGRPGKYEAYQPRVDTLRKIAEAFPATSLMELQRLAGMMDEEPSPSPTTERIMTAAERLSPENRRIIEALITTLLEEQRNGNEKQS